MLGGFIIYSSLQNGYSPVLASGTLSNEFKLRGQENTAPANALGGVD
jgi:hypothetical protein